jgi:hypothetical protein
MINCTLINDSKTEKTVFRQAQDSDTVWIDMYDEDGKIWKTLGLDETMALDLKRHLLENTALKEDPYHSVKVVYKEKNVKN